MNIPPNKGWHPDNQDVITETMEGTLMPKQQNFSDEILKAWCQSGMTLRWLVELPGVDKGTLSKLGNGHRGLAIGTAEKVAHTLGLRLVKSGKGVK